MNQYELTSAGCTTGWDFQANDVNGNNFYGMRPIEVAAQAAHLEEFQAIFESESFDPVGARVRFFASVGRLSGGTHAEQRYARLLPLIVLYEERFSKALA